MVVAAGLIALSESFGGMTSGAEVLDALEGMFQSFGATHFLATGFPLPGRPIAPLIVRLHWGDLRCDRPNGHSGMKTDDPILHMALRARRPFTWFDSRREDAAQGSPLVSTLGAARDMRIIAVPICAFLPYQAVVMAGGTALSIDTRALLAIDHVCVEAFRRLFALGFMRPERPGDLSARERRVVELSASGKTASEIAAILQISQRTVHAHLQNASEKLGASNKTHTVVEALRYGQISV
jgi:LuxR family quorum sensing-dependent transcriptional regulator